MVVLRVGWGGPRRRSLQRNRDCRRVGLTHTARMADTRRVLLPVIIVLAAVWPLAGTQNPSGVMDSGRSSDVEKAYVPLALTTRVSETP